MMSSSATRKAIADWAKKSESLPRIRAMIELAKSQPRIHTTIDAFDRDPWLFNCMNGTIDLRTGELREHRREDYITKRSMVSYDENAPCPTWDSFLSRIMAGNEDLIDYLQRVFGFCLTGIVPDRIMWFLHGGGCNGKTTLLNAIRGVMCAYAQHIPAETLMLKRFGDGIPNDLAKLRGARMVNTAELSQGMRLNEARIKDLTGRDEITARFMRKEWFTFKPVFKLVMAGNHKPRITGTDDATWDRLKLVPFDVRIPEDEKDPQMDARLQSEYPGILAWMVRGSWMYQRGGLQHPPVVAAAVNDYRNEEDDLGQFLAACCILGEDKQASASSLFEAFQVWSGDKKITQTGLGRLLGGRGFKSTQGTSGAMKGCRVWLGIGVITDRE